MAQPIVYLDNNATTRPHPDVVSAMLPFLSEHYGNPSSIHRLGQMARKAIDESRAIIARSVGATDREISFTGGGTEAINSAVRGILATRGTRKRIVTTTVEHSAMRELAGAMEKEGITVTRVNVDSAGRLNLDEFSQALGDDVALVSMIWANNETGVIFPMQQIAGICKAKSIPLFCDATQCIGKMPVDFKQIGVDAATFSPHKFHGPKGVGIMYLRKGQRMRPLILGGPQENNRRGGTENVPGIVGAAKAIEIANRRLDDLPRIAQLRDRLESSILNGITDTQFNGCRDDRLCNTSNIGFARLEAEAILISLSEQGICASAGAACSSGSLEPSPVLRAMKVPEIYAHGSLRFSFSHDNTPADVDRTLQVLPNVIQKLRKVLPI